MLRPFLLDASVMMDAFLPFRERHEECLRLFARMTELGAKSFIPSHAYFEYTTALVTYAKKEPQRLRAYVRPTFPAFSFSVISLTRELVESLSASLHGGPIPDLKSQDLIYFCLARKETMNLLTEDRKLHRVSNKAGIRAFFIDEALALLSSTAANGGDAQA